MNSAENRTFTFVNALKVRVSARTSCALTDSTKSVFAVIMLGHPVFGVVLLLACNAFGHVPGNRAIAKPPLVSPEASTSLICPSADSSDCYPSIFQPAVHFQHIRPGQSIPPGLHVRLNIATGEKEARLNIPEENEGHEGAVLVIDNVDETEGSSEAKAEAQVGSSQTRLEDHKSHLNAKTSEKAQKPVPKSRPHHRPEFSEASQYDTAKEVIMNTRFIANQPASQEQTNALADLTDLAHDLDWGRTITEDIELCDHLSRMILSVDASGPAAMQDLRPSIFLLLGTAIQNNMPANSDLQNFQKTGAMDLIARTTEILVHEQHRRLEHDDEHVFASTLTSRAVFFLSQFCADENILKHFVYDSPAFLFSTKLKTPSSGLAILRDLFSPTPAPQKQHSEDHESSQSHQKSQIRIANFLTDHASTIASINQAGPDRTDRSILNDWCDVLSAGMDGRRKAFGRRRKSQLAEDTAFQSFLAAKGAIAQALAEHNFGLPGGCGSGSARMVDNEMGSEL